MAEGEERTQRGSRPTALGRREEGLVSMTLSTKNTIKMAAALLLFFLAIVLMGVISQLPH
jgi:hypothetical protein